MMRNSINSYLTSLVMVLALLLSANAFATETVRSTITIDDEEYALFTGFNAINGAAGTNADPDFVRLVDGDISSEWSAVLSQAGEYAFVEFSSDYPIILRGFIVNLYNTTVSRHPTEVKLYAKANEADEYVEVSSYSVATSSDMERTFPITMENNTMYRYFKFEFANSGRNIKLTEIRLYGEKELTYGFMPEKNASCMETGIKQACYLRSDGRYFTDKTGTKELSKEDVIDPLKPHDLIHHEEDDAHYEYWECSVCGKRFGDAEGTKELDIVDFTYDYTKYRILTNSSDNWLFFRINDTHSINSKRSVVGDVVTLKVLERYIDVNSIKVSDGANDYPITSEGNGIYSFTVPASDVTISAEIKPEYKEPTFFGIGNDELDNYIFTPGVSTVRLNSDIRYVIRNRVGLMLDSKDITTRLYVPFADVEGEFRDALSVGISVTETGWYDISFNEVGDGKWNLSISATTRKPQIETISDQVYTGEDIMPKPVVTLDLYDLTEGSDYEYSYSNNVNVGSSATVTVTFKGDYAEFGSVSKSFNITKATPTVEPPTSANPKYAGNCVELVNPGITNFGVILYSIKEDEGYSSDIPCADAAGNYKIYYKVEERDNWFGVEEQSVDVTVELAKFKVTYVDEDGSEISSTDYQYGTPTTLLVPTREGYAFVGWYKSADFFGEAVASIADDATGALTFYAKWQELPTLVNKGTVSECFEISSVNQLYSFAALVNGVITASQLPSGYPVGSNICGKLANEIVVNENVLDDEGKLNTVTEGGFRTWTPIGNSSKQYTGTFDGQGFAIKGLYFNEGLKDSVGLFGYVGSDGKVKNVGVEDSYFRGLNVVGGVAGYNQGSIANSYNSSSVAGGDNYVGGVAGINVGSIANSYNSGSVTGGNIFVGSVTGINDGSIKNCFAKSGSPIGLVSPAGVAFRDETEFHDGTVAILLHNGTNGYVWGQNVGTDAYPVLSNTYDAEGNLQPGVVKFNLEYVLNEGSNAANAASTHSYGTETELPIPTREGYAFAGWYENEDFSGDAVKTIAAAAQISATAQTVGENTIWTKKYYAKWSFAYTITYELNGKDAINSDVDNSANPSVYLEGVELSLAIPTREGYGFVGWYNSADFSGEPVSSIAADASGAKTFYARWQEIPVLAGNQCYEISNVEQLYGFAALVNGTVSVPADMPSGVSICGRLTKNIYVNGSATNPLQSQLVKDADGNVTNGTSFRTWTLIGNSSKRYTGTFDGQGFAIKGLYFNDESEKNVGLFGYVGSDGKVENVGVEDSYFRGQNNVGGVTGFNGGSVTNCYNSGSVNATDEYSYVGGVTGFNEGSITNCYNSGSVNTTGEYYVGGVTGSNEGSVTNCYNSGSVNTTGEYYVGGVTGFNGGSVTNCYNSGTDKYSNVGGVTGINGGSVTNSFAKTGSAEKLIFIDFGNSFGSGFKTGEEFSNGTVAALLHNGIDGSVWGQNLADEISYPDFSGKIEFNYGSIVIAADKSKATILGNSTETANVPNPVEVNSVEFERTFVASPEGLNIANTIVLPFSTNEGTTANADFYAFTGVTVEDGVYTAEFRTEVKVAALEAGVPYAVILKEEATNLNMTLGSPVSVQTAELNNPKVGDWEFSGSYANRYWENGCTALECVYGFAAADDVDGIYKAGDFVKGGSDVSVKPMRAVLSRTSDQSNSGNGMLRAPAYRGVSRAIAEDVPEVIAVLFGNADGEVTFVGQMNTRTGNITLEKADRWFDMKGRRLNGKPTVKGTYYNNGKKVIIK